MPHTNNFVSAIQRSVAGFAVQPVPDYARSTRGYAASRRLIQCCLQTHLVPDRVRRADVRAAGPHHADAPRKQFSQALTPTTHSGFCN